MIARKIEQLPIGNQPWLTIDPGVCNHENGFTDMNGESVCNDCGWTCSDHKFVDGACECCGYECEHPEFEDGYCVECEKYIGDCMDSDSLYDAWKERDL